MNSQIRSVSFLGYKINPVTKEELLGLFEERITSRHKSIFTHLNLHGLAVMYESRVMARLVTREDVLTTIDGMAVVWLARLFGCSVCRRHRITSLDYIHDLMALAVNKKWKIVYVGGTPDVIAKGIDIFRAKYPGLKIDGYDGYFEMGELYSLREQEILQAARGADILIVGMGMPRQELWVSRVEGQVDATVIITIGAMMEYFTGALPMPPRWLGPLGGEWLFRLVTAPRRLAYRYLVEPLVLLAKLSVNPAPWRTNSDEENRRRETK